MSNLTALVIGLAGVAIILKVPVKTLDKRVSVPDCNQQHGVSRESGVFCIKNEPEKAH